VQHDANHGACSRKQWINDLFGFGADWIGGSKWLWMEQHWTHHAFTNDEEKDPDTNGGAPFVLFHDYPLGHPARTWMHAMQAFYLFPLLAFYALGTVISPQVIDLKHQGALASGIKMENDFLTKRRPLAIFLRIIYIFINIVTPFLHHGLSWTAFFHINFMFMCGSYTLAIPFSLSHNFEEVERFPMEESRKKGEAAVCWYKAQAETSSTYGGMISGMVTGGLNFQVEHHMFPRMSSAWYPYIAPKVREVCKKHGVRYVYYPWIWQNLISTLRYTHAAGTGATWKSQNKP